MTAQPVARRPFWQTQPCPPWCGVSAHEDIDPVEDREHYTVDDDASIDLTLLKPVEYGPGQWGPETMFLGLAQREREVGPRVTIQVGQTGPACHHLTLGEAEQVARRILDMVTAARAGVTT